MSLTLCQQNYVCESQAGMALIFLYLQELLVSPFKTEILRYGPSPPVIMDMFPLPIIHKKGNVCPLEQVEPSCRYEKHNTPSATSSQNKRISTTQPTLPTTAEQPCSIFKDAIQVKPLNQHSESSLIEYCILKIMELGEKK